MSRTHCYHRYLVAAGLPSANEGGNILSFFESNKADHVVAATVSHSLAFQSVSITAPFYLALFCLHVYSIYYPLPSLQLRALIGDATCLFQLTVAKDPYLMVKFTMMQYTLDHHYPQLSSLLSLSSATPPPPSLCLHSPSLFPPTSVVPLLHIHPHLHPRSP